MPRLTKALREELLARLRNGHELDSAASTLGITEAQLEAGGAALAKETAAAYRIGTGKLKARSLELSLSREDGAALAKLVD